jgi:hypothetical protein
MRHEAAGGCALIAGWLGAVTFAVSCGLLALFIVSRDAGAFGYGVVMILGVALLGIVAFGIAAVAWVVHRLRHHRRPRARAAAAFAVLAVALVLLGGVVAGVVGWIEIPPDAWWPGAIGVTLLALAAVLAADRWERLPALLFAAVWVAILATAGYRTWTDLEVRVVWLAPSAIADSPGLVGFTATRSADYEVRYGAASCGEGRLIATGRYAWRPDHADSAHGAPEWVDLPLDVLPLRQGDVVRVCLRDGLAAGTASGESAGPGMGFWPRD